MQKGTKKEGRGGERERPGTIQAFLAGNDGNPVVSRGRKEMMDRKKQWTKWSMREE